MPFQEPAYEHGDQGSVFIQREGACVQQLELFGGTGAERPAHIRSWGQIEFLAFFIVYQATCKYHIPARL